MRLLKRIYSEPSTAWLTVLGIDFGAIMIIRPIFEPGHKFYFGKWLSFKVGDLVFLPSLAALAATALQDPVLRAKYPNKALLLILLVAGLISGNSVLKNAQIKMLFDPAVLASDKYHTVIYWVMFPLIGSTFPALWQSTDTIHGIRVRYLAGGTLVCFLATVPLDYVIQGHI